MVCESFNFGACSDLGEGDLCLGEIANFSKERCERNVYSALDPKKKIHLFLGGGFMKFVQDHCGDDYRQEVRIKSGKLAGMRGFLFEGDIVIVNILGRWLLASAEYELVS